LVLHLVSEGDSNVAALQSKGFDPFTAKSHSMVNLLHTAAVAYVELTILCWFYDYVNGVPMEFRAVLMKLCKLFALSTIDKHLARLYMANYTNSPQFGRHLQDQRVQLQSSLVPEAVSLCDSLAPSDFVLRSALGHSSGNVYENLMGELEAASTYRAPFWADLCQFLDEQKNKGEKSKL